jgi:hypothetical protein
VVQLEKFFVLGIIQLSIKVFWCSEEWVVGLMKILYCRSGVMVGQLALMAGLTSG